MTDSSRLNADVSSVNAGCAGASNGAEIPVKFLISPRRAFAYKPFTSLRSHSSMGVLTYTSRKSSFPIIFAAISRMSLLGLIKAAIVIMPVSTNNFGNLGYTADVLYAVGFRKAQIVIDAAADIVSVQNTAKQSAFMQLTFQSDSYRTLTRPAQPGKPEIITLCCFRSSSLSCLDNILSKIGYILFSVIIQSKWPY